MLGDGFDERRSKVVSGSAATDDYALVSCDEFSGSVRLGKFIAQERMHSLLTKNVECILFVLKTSLGVVVATAMPDRSRRQKQEAGRRN